MGHLIRSAAILSMVDQTECLTRDLMNTVLID